MRLRVYRCYACLSEDRVFGRNFEVRLEDNAPLVKLHDGTRGPSVTCPNCGMSNAHPALGGNVVPVEVLHFEPPATAALYGRSGRGTIACNPATKVIGSPGLRFTGEPLAVNCPECMKTPEYLKQMNGGIHPSFDIPLLDDGKGNPVVPELHAYQKPADPTQPPTEPLSEV